MLLGNTQEKFISYCRKPKGPLTQGQWTTSHSTEAMRTGNRLNPMPYSQSQYNGFDYCLSKIIAVGWRKQVKYGGNYLNGHHGEHVSTKQPTDPFPGSTLALPTLVLDTLTKQLLQPRAGSVLWANSGSGLCTGFCSSLKNQSFGLKNSNHHVATTFPGEIKSVL